jgi:NAD(P)-dependent dehydrogenase (short-subunit alcohol dehydrogenase family)
MGERVVVVTGSSGGIGAAILQRFDALGEVTVGLDLSEGFDVADPGACETAAGRVLDEFGRVDVLCNNAGVGAVGAIGADVLLDGGISGVRLVE